MREFGREGQRSGEREASTTIKTAPFYIISLKNHFLEACRVFFQFQFFPIGKLATRPAHVQRHKMLQITALRGLRRTNVLEIAALS